MKTLETSLLIISLLTVSTTVAAQKSTTPVFKVEYEKFILKNGLIYGKDNIRSRNILGTVDSVNAITLDDLKAFYAKSVSPSVTRMNVVGSLHQTQINSSLKSLESKWKGKAVEIASYKTPEPPAKSVVYFYDVPKAKQSVIRFGYPALAQSDKDFYPATVMNYILGGGGFASRLTQELRESKGYTYGINSGFSGTHSPGPFTIAGGVRSNVTLESAQLIKASSRIIQKPLRKTTWLPRKVR